MSRLLRAAKEAGNRNPNAYLDIIREIGRDHTKQLEIHVHDQDIRVAVCEQIEDELKKLVKFLGAVQEIGEVSAKSLDTIISKGELLACLFLSALLQDQGVDAECVDLSDIIDFDEETQDLDDVFYTRLTEALMKKVRACKSRVPVLTGYFGIVRGGLLNKVGRGYTDLCAALVAAGLQASELQIWKEVDGIFTANPSKVPTAKLLPTISPSEAAELTFYGSEVIHPFTMERVMRAKVPIRIRNVLDLRKKGTTIMPEPDPPQYAPSRPSSPSFFRKRAYSKPTYGQKPPRPVAITVKDKVLVINVHSNKRTLSHGFYANIFSVLDKWRLSVDLISTSEVCDPTCKLERLVG